MSLPKYNELYNAFLGFIKDGEVHSIMEVKDKIAADMNLSEESLAEMISNGRQTVFYNRVGWTNTYLKKAGLVNSPARSQVVITAEGKRLIESGVRITNKLLTEKYPSFAEFIRPSRSSGENRGTVPEEGEEASETPLEAIERMYQTINDSLADELLTEIMNHDSAFFEQLSVDLMRAMNYGNGFVTRHTGDGGVDGIINEDRLGFSQIYIQAKRWNPDKTIQRSDIQEFRGAMMGPPRVEKGLYITTAKFSSGARAYADTQHIILIDGKRLTELMTAYGLGVSVQKTYSIKQIDSNYFSDNN